MLSAPGFHHLHLNSVDPDAAIAFYVRQFPTSKKASWGGLPALACPNGVLILFTRVAAAPATSPPTAIWHFGCTSPTRARASSPTGAGRTSGFCRSTRPTKAAPSSSAATRGRA